MWSFFSWLLSICNCCCPKSSKVSSKTFPVSNNVSKGVSIDILKKASQMKKTVGGIKISPVIHKRMLTKAQQSKLKESIPWELKRAISEPYDEFSKVTPYLYLTGAGGMVKENLIGNSITCVINVSHELPVYDIPGLECIRIPVEDSPKEDLRIYFNPVSDKINQIAKRKGKVVVHCFVGVSRSVTIVIAYLMKYKKMTLRQAFIYVKQIRNAIKPNMVFFYQLMEYEIHLFSKSSINLVEITVKDRTVKIPDLYKLYYFTEEEKEEEKEKELSTSIGESYSQETEESFISVVSLTM